MISAARSPSSQLIACFSTFAMGAPHTGVGVSQIVCPRPIGLEGWRSPARARQHAAPTYRREMSAVMELSAPGLSDHENNIAIHPVT
jgi:hypothetical protein